MEIVKTIRIPEGYQIDKERSSDRKIILKKIEDKRVRTWEEYSKKMEGKDSYYYDETFKEIRSARFNDGPLLSEFEDKEEAEAFAAFGKLRKFRKDWIGEWEPDYENDCEPKFAIITVENKISKEGVNYTVKTPDGDVKHLHHPLFRIRKRCKIKVIQTRKNIQQERNPAARINHGELCKRFGQDVLQRF